jgi:energy-coupling factor transporter ATP-binding protein EcfA2
LRQGEFVSVIGSSGCGKSTILKIMAVLLLDEPFSALDELTRDFMNMELQRICLERQASTFLVTHSIPAAVILSDRILVMQALPCRIADVVSIDLPRPRTLDLINTLHFGHIVKHMRERLDQKNPTVTSPPVISDVISDVENRESLMNLDGVPHTVWTNRDPFIDRIPRWVAMLGLFVAIVGIWYAVTALEIVNKIILP